MKTGKDSNLDDAGYTEAWAKDLVAAIGKREARHLLERYRTLASDPKITKHGREIAAERARILETMI